MPNSKKTASVTVNVTPALKTRIAANARRADQTVSAFLGDLLSQTFYKRGEPKMRRIGKHVKIYDRPVRVLPANALDGPVPDYIKNSKLTPNL